MLGLLAALTWRGIHDIFWGDGGMIMFLLVFAIVVIIGGFFTAWAARDQDEDGG